LLGDDLPTVAMRVGRLFAGDYFFARYGGSDRNSFEK
jgi:hypothetical protein